MPISLEHYSESVEPLKVLVINSRGPKAVPFLNNYHSNQPRYFFLRVDVIFPGLSQSDERPHMLCN